ncbi:hypothetical protein [Streptomyces jumonjinensis]|uniref:hypothetical protein n=1 Tax=Streptomyces jumonjinensis TaxID=1945 RepID=UPI001E3CF041|nr:hypothetical protein [Streptomyces jumonjinensis]
MGGLDRARKVRLQLVNGQRLDDPQFTPTMPAAAGRMAGGDPAPGQRVQRREQGRLVVLDHQQVVRLLVRGEEADVLALGVQRVGGDGDPGQVEGGRAAGRSP